MLKNGRYDEAASSFQQFLQQHPEGPYADNAQYWLGESYYVTSQFEQALAAFRKVPENYPDSAKLPDARLKVGFTLYEMGRMDEARAVLRKVTEEHANSAVAGLAEDRLLKMEREASQQ
ncbi:MAG: tol-pal system protein YbgF [Halofilum sp. (in: g-proteobacteria)]|nr:tol-pal system protein YbgF [Halofilum sp. (in: g-proteobacteria)]